MISGDSIAELRAALRQAKDREAHLQGVIETLPEAIYITAPDGKLEAWNPAAEALFGYTVEDVLGQHVADLGPPGSENHLRTLLVSIVAGEEVPPYETSHITSSGAEIATIDSVAALHDTSGTTTAVAWSSRSIDELNRLERIVWEEKERTETAFDLVADAVFMTDVDGRVSYMNAAATEISGWSIAEAHGEPIDQIVRLEHEESRDPVRSPLLIALDRGQPVETGFHYVVVHRDGSVRPIEDAAAPITARDGSIAGAVLVLRSITPTVPAAASSNYVAVEDPATGMLGRRELEHRLEQALLTASRDNAAHTLLALRVQGYDEFVQNYGQTAGIELLRQIAVMLRTQIRNMDPLARLQRGEYAVLLQHCPLEQGQRIAQQARRLLRNFPFYWNGASHEIVVQFGVIPVTSDSGSVSRILQIADIASQTADTDGIDLVHVLDVGDINRAMSSRRSDRTRQIVRAFDNDRFRLYGQRIRPLDTRGSYGEQVEILVHMMDDSGEVIGPFMFLPAAERLNLAGRVDRWVVRKVFEMLAGKLHEKIASWTINLSEETVNDPSFVEFVRIQMQRSRTLPQSICFEIDEAVATAHVGATQRLIELLRPLGFAFSLSSFGGSPNSFAYVRNLHVDYLKIDGSLVRAIDADTVNRAVVTGIVNVAVALGIRTIASMVEDREALDTLRTLGVDYVQGFAVAEPLPIPLAPQT